MSSALNCASMLCYIKFNMALFFCKLGVVSIKLRKLAKKIGNWSIFFCLQYLIKWWLELDFSKKLTDQIRDLIHRKLRDIIPQTSCTREQNDHVSLT